MSNAATTAPAPAAPPPVEKIRIKVDGRDVASHPLAGTAPRTGDAATDDALAEALVRTRAMDAELAYELIAARADLQRIVTAVRIGADTSTEAQPDIRTLQGWRRELVGEELLELLHGRRELRVGADLGVEVRAQDATPTT